jgi:hypothetical protein
MTDDLASNLCLKYRFPFVCTSITIICVGRKKEMVKKTAE